MTISLNERKKWEKEADTVILNSGSHNQMFEMSSRVLRLLAALRATETRAAEFEGQAERYSQELACAERERDALCVENTHIKEQIAEASSGKAGI